MIVFNPPTTLSHDEVLHRFAEILQRGIVTNNGPCVKALEEELVAFARTEYALTTANGTLGLHLAIRSMQLKGEIITTPFTFVATSSSIVWEGCTPVFVDVDPATFCMDPSAIEAKITDRTVAILPVHIYGCVCDIDAIEAVAARHGLPTIYDAAHACGSDYNGRPALSYGTASVLSTHAYKIFNTVEGGVVFTSDEEVYGNLFRLRYFGKEMDNTEVMIGINGKMNEFNAAYGSLSLAAVKSEIAARTRITERYFELLRPLEGIGFQKIPGNVTSNCAYFPILMPTEAKALELLDAGTAAGIQFRRYFYPVLNSLDFLPGRPGDTPVAADIASRVLCIPLYSALSEEEIGRIVNTIKKVIQG